MLSFVFLVGLSVAPIFGCSDDSAPTDSGPEAVLAISYPESGAFINKSRVMVRGTAEGVDTVKVNGNQAEVVSGEWKVLVDFAEGEALATASAGKAEASVDFVVDTIAPVIELAQPARGLMQADSDGDQVVFAGRVTEEVSGLKVLGLDGAGVSFDEDGNFTHSAELRPGYNEFELKAVDGAGNESKTMRAVVFGPLAGATDEIDSAAEILLSPALFADAGDVILSLMTPERLSEFLQGSMADNENFQIDSIDYSDASVEIAPHSMDPLHDTGYITIDLSVEALVIAGTVTFEGESLPVTITIDQVAISTELTLAATEAGGLDISFSESVLEFEEDALHFDVAGKTEQDLGEGLRNVLFTVATGVAKTAFSEILSDELFAQLYDPGLLRRSVELLGRTLEFQLYIRQVRITEGDGIFVKASIAVVSPKFEGVPDVPGALDLPQGPRTSSSLAGDLLVSTRRTAVNRILHGAWRSGLLNLALVGSDFAGFELPVELSASALSVLLDSRISQLADKSTPAGLKLRPLLPPIVDLKQSPAAVEAGANDIRLQLGDLMADLQLLPSDGAPIDIATVALYVDISAQFTSRDGKLGLTMDATARADVAEEPTLDLDDAKIEDLLTNLVGLATQMLGNKLELGADTELGWLRVREPQAEVHGVEFDQLSVAADVEAVPQE
ncbi:hypothetical protein [Bradymonas sediminis]|uniref:Uncharacterized protein n=1 Tax=Bradymonas sediminis TaxID=1548548 RepID=A0A2Z4FQ71_9DELT|nr:hypothetical protein [Bradymonas sediminis]AWV90784.1 hypothetical protein DN745_16255 [Bradymonas sediminis]TDP75482.1 hypothetical protein DFR33_104350 [Bradymonas sediminis]